MLSTAQYLGRTRDRPTICRSRRSTFGRVLQADGRDPLDMDRPSWILHVV